MGREIELDNLEKVILRYVADNPSDGELLKALAALGRLRKEYEVIPRAELTELREQTQKLKESPLQYALYLGPSPSDERDLIVGVNNARLEARVSNELKERVGQLALGQQVLLNEHSNVVAIRGEYVRGETAEVINVLKPDGSAEVTALVEDEGVPLRAFVKWRDGKEVEVSCSEEVARAGLRRGDIVELDSDGMRATAKVRPRLHVKAGGSEGTVVEISDCLFEEGVRLGDLVRVELGLKFAFEKLPSFETGELILEEVPDVTYADIGGLDAQIESFSDAIELPYLQRLKFEKYQLSRPKGILLYGPPGCGKTMVAKAVANSLNDSIRDHLYNLEERLKLYVKLKAKPTDAALLEEGRKLFRVEGGDDGSHPPGGSVLKKIEESLRTHDVDPQRPEEKLREIGAVLKKEGGVRSYFLNVKGPELLDKYVGETEHRIRSIFEEARRHASYYTPVIIFFDEMEAMFRARGSGRSSDVETTIVPQFLSEIDGVESSAHVLLIGATNRDDMIDPAILRPGRLDVKIKIDRPTREAAAEIFSFYLGPMLPLDGTGLAPARTPGALGDIVYRTAYSKAAGEAGAIGELLPQGCDLRLALSISEEETGKLSALSPVLTVRQALARGQEGMGSSRLWAKLSRFKASLKLGSLTERLAALSVRRAADAGLRRAMEHYVRMEWLAEAMIQDAVSLLYSPASVLKVLTKAGTHYTFPLSDFVTGAVIANIVSRAKRVAIKREIDEPGNPSEGISSGDLRTAIRNEFEETREQLALYKLRDEMNRGSEAIQSVDVQLELGEADPWSEEKRRAYAGESRQAARLSHEP
jgi:SpoVK/Ycf46/Vps4 family AAA+-type ATPase